MARITVEDCLDKESNRFALVQLAAKRTKQILQGGKVVLEESAKNKAVVTALREIAEGNVRFMTEAELEEQQRKIAEEQRAREEARAAAAAAQAALTPDSLFKSPSEVAAAAQNGGSNGAHDESTPDA